MKNQGITNRKIGIVNIETLKSLEEALGGNKELVLFFLMWMKMDRNATKAYLALHPNVTYESARVLGCNTLTKISIPVILESYGLGVSTYLERIKEGLEATVSESVEVKKKEQKGKKTEYLYKEVKRPDWVTRGTYHDKLGKLLGFEGQPGPSVAVQVNQNNIEGMPDADLDAVLLR